MTKQTSFAEAEQPSVLIIQTANALRHAIPSLFAHSELKKHNK